jgi:hypothetical protein
MGRARTQQVVVVAVVVALVAALSSPALCLETKLAGVSLGDTPDDLLSSPSFGTPDAMFAPGNAFSFIGTREFEMPVWATAVRMAAVGGDQIQWIYNRDPAVIGLLMTGSGIDAHVTNIVVSQWRTFASSKVAETEKGIRIGDTFADVLRTYGWPNRMDIINETGRRITPATPAAGAPSAPGGAISGGGGRGSEEDGGPGALPPVGPAFGFVPAGAAPADALTATANAGPAGMVGFTKSCILSYPSVDFVLYRMRVFRIHIYGR